MRYGFLISIVTTLAACSHTPLPLPVHVGNFESPIELPARGKILVYTHTSQCESVRAAAQFQAFPKKGDAVVLKAHCEGAKFTAQSEVLAPGAYTLRLSLRGRSLRELQPRVTLELVHPDHRSGPDQYAEGAIPLEAAKPLESTVDYLAGDRTDWLRLAGEKKRVTLTFVAPEESHSHAAVYKVAGLNAQGEERLALIKSLRAGKPASFYLGKDDLLVKVVASNEDALTPYSLSRRDEDAKKQVSLQVVDAYPVGPSISLVLLRPHAEVKAEDELNIAAKTVSGSWKELGACRVQQVTPEAIQCELNGAWSERFTEYRATETAPVSG